MLSSSVHLLMESPLETNLNDSYSYSALSNFSKLTYETSITNITSITNTNTNTNTNATPTEIIILTNIYNNSTDNHEESLSHNHGLLFIVFTSLILGFLILSTVIGNVFVIAAIFLERNLRTVGNYLVLSLAVADTLVACLVMPLGALYEVNQEWTLGRELCDLWTFADVLCCTASILHLLAIAIDRYWAVTNVDYIHQRNAKRIGIMIISIWLVAVIVSLAPYFGWKDPEFLNRIEKEKICLVSQDIGYQIFATVASFYGPLIFILALYWKIFQVARKRIRRKPGKFIAPVNNSQTPKLLGESTSTFNIDRTDDQTVTSFSQPKEICHSNNSENNKLSIISDKSSAFNCTNNNPSSSTTYQDQSNVQMLVKTKKSVKETIESKREKKAAKTLAIITGVFVVCWLPFFVNALVMSICIKCQPSKFVLSLLLWLGYVNSLLNPIIYTIFSPDFRNGFRRILCGRDTRRIRS